MTSKYLLVFALLLTAACGNYTTVRSSSDYATALSRTENMTFIPADVKATTVDISGKTEEMFDYGDHVEGVIADVLIPALNKKEYRVTPLHKQEIKDRKLYEEVHQAKATFEVGINDLYKTAIKKEQALATDKQLGDPVATLGSKTGSAIFVMVKYVEMIQTDGARARDFVVGALLGGGATPAEMATIVVGLVDAKTGKVLWMNHAFDAHSLIGSGIDGMGDQNKLIKDRITILVDKVLKPLPDKSKLFEPVPEEK